MGSDPRLLSSPPTQFSRLHSLRFWKAEDKPWGVCELAVIDTDGNLIRMGHDLENELDISGKIMVRLEPEANEGITRYRKSLVQFPILNF